MASEGLCDAGNCVVQSPRDLEARDLNSLLGVLPQRVRRDGELDILVGGTWHWLGQDDKFLHLGHTFGEEASLQFTL